MKKTFVFALIAFVSQSTIARIELNQVATDNEKIFGTPNKIFVQKSCKDQLEELLVLEKKVAYMDGIETILRQYVGNDQIVPTAVEQAATHIKDLEDFGIMARDEKAYKNDLFNSACHAQANPVHTEAQK